MGDGSAHCGADEREVMLTQDFFVGVTEVTNKQYRSLVQWAYDQGYVTATELAVYDALGSSLELLNLDDELDCEITFDPVTETFGLKEARRALQDAYPGGYDPTHHPVKEVTWYGAASYCDWLSLAEGFSMAYDHGTWSCGPGGNAYEASGYRLPTDAEWEYVAQYEDERMYPWGDEEPTCSFTNFRHYSDEMCVGWTSPVGTYPSGAQPNLSAPIYDLAGNLFEWCNDWWECSLGTQSAIDPVGPQSGSGRVRRGGRFSAWPSGLPVAARSRGAFPGLGDNGVGFRVVRSAIP